MLIGAEHLFYTKGKQNPNLEHYALVLYLISLIRLSIYKSLVHFQLRARHYSMRTGLANRNMYFRCHHECNPIIPSHLVRSP